MKKLVCFLLACVLAIPVLGACDTVNKEELSNYKINAVLNDDKLLTVDMELDYRNNAQSDMNNLMLHLYPNAYREGARFSPVAAEQIAEAFPLGRSYAELNITKVSVNGTEQAAVIEGQDEDILTVSFASPLKPTKRATVNISYTLKIPVVRHRLGWFDRTVNLGNFYPIACVYENGAFVTDPYYSTGDPFYSECANYAVTLTAPKSFKGAFSGDITNESVGADTVTYTVKADMVREFAAVLGEFSVLSGKAGSTTVNYYYCDDAAPEAALKAAIDSINTFSSLFGAYPYSQYSVVKTHFLQGGMEYPGLVYISDRVNGDMYYEVIIHETAHQWWYAVVGNNQIENAWMDEGLSEYSTMLFYQNNPDYNIAFEDKFADALSSYMLYCELYKENGKGDTSMNRRLPDYATSNEYLYMIYVKGSLMFDSIKSLIGEKAFYKGMKNYYSENKYRIARPDDMIGALEKAAGISLKSIFNSWIEGSVLMYGGQLVA